MRCKATRKCAASGNPVSNPRKTLLEINNAENHLPIPYTFLIRYYVMKEAKCIYFLWRYLTFYPLEISNTSL